MKIIDSALVPVHVLPTHTNYTVQGHKYVLQGVKAENKKESFI